MKKLISALVAITLITTQANAQVCKAPPVEKHEAILLESAITVAVVAWLSTLVAIAVNSYGDYKKAKQDLGVPELEYHCEYRVKPAETK